MSQLVQFILTRAYEYAWPTPALWGLSEASPGPDAKHESARQRRVPNQARAESRKRYGARRVIAS